MIKEILTYLKAWVKGDDAELNIDETWHFSWWELVPIIMIISLVVFWIWK